MAISASNMQTTESVTSSQRYSMSETQSVDINNYFNETTSTTRNIPNGMPKQQVSATNLMIQNNLIRNNYRY